MRISDWSSDVCSSDLSAIFGPKGVVLAEADKFETKRRAVFDMESYRKAHRIPDVHFSLYRHVYDDYRERYDPNMWLARVPETKRDAYDYLKDKFRWTSFWQDRKSVVEGKGVSVRVEVGGPRNNK